ncbi:MAG: GNAT family N-acetyltransferase [Patescibacteria group bacterium]|jgi:GNAT superfamily N-acetyltransferase
MSHVASPIIAVRYQVFTRQGQALEMDPQLLSTWSALSEAEPHMLSVSKDELRSTLLFAVIATFGDEPIGFSGIFPARTKDGHQIVRDKHKLVEFGSAVVVEPWRGQHIGRMMLQIRQHHALNAGYWGVCVTTNPIVQDLLRDNGWEITNDLELKRDLCLCDPQPLHYCATCPLREDACWLLV